MDDEPFRAPMRQGAGARHGVILTVVRQKNDLDPCDARIARQVIEVFQASFEPFGLVTRGNSDRNAPLGQAAGPSPSWEPGL
jgi:hypothetical protein